MIEPCRRRLQLQLQDGHQRLLSELQAAMEAVLLAPMAKLAVGVAVAVGAASEEVAFAHYSALRHSSPFDNR